MDDADADLLRKRLERERLARKQAERIIEEKSRELFTKNQELAEKNRELLELDQLKNRFLGIAAHDMRSPLGSIKGFSQLMLSEATGALTAEQQDFLGTICRISEEMLRLLNDLLDVSAIESGRLDLELARASLRQMLEERIRINRFLAEKKGIAVQTKLADTPDVLFDAHRIGQVVDNLLGNAVKFSPPGSHIVVSLEARGRVAEIRVADEGPGVPPEDLPKLFGTFQRLSAKPTGGEKSTGLGLSIVHRIVEAHHGTVTVESAPGSGATFVVTLPLADPA